MAKWRERESCFLNMKDEATKVTWEAYLDTWKHCKGTGLPDLNVQLTKRHLKGYAMLLSKPVTLLCTWDLTPRPDIILSGWVSYWIQWVSVSLFWRTALLLSNNKKNNNI